MCATIPPPNKKADNMMCPPYWKASPLKRGKLQEKDKAAYFTLARAAATSLISGTEGMS